MNVIPYDKIKEYISKNCPWKGLCFLDDPDNRCNYEMMDGIPCRYMPKLVMEFKKKWQNVESVKKKKGQ